MLEIAEILNLVRFDLLKVLKERWILTHFTKYDRRSKFHGWFQCQLLPHGCIALCPTFYHLGCKKLAPTPSSVRCSQIIMAAHRKSSQQAVKKHWNPMAPLLRLFCSLTFRWPCVRHTNNDPHYRRAVSAWVLVVGSRNGKPHELVIMGTVNDHDIEGGVLI